MGLEHRDTCTKQKNRPDFQNFLAQKSKLLPEFVFHNNYKILPTAGIADVDILAKQLSTPADNQSRFEF